MYLQTMDPSIFLQYSPPNGVPQESKLATYMNRSATTPIGHLNHSLGKLTLEASPPSTRKVLISEFVPVSYYAPPPIIPSPTSSPPNALSVVPPNPQVHQENVGGTTYFYSTNDGASALNTSSSMGSGDPMQAMGVPMGPVVATSSPYASQIYAGQPIPQQMPSKPGSGDPMQAMGVPMGPVVATSSPYASQIYAGQPIPQQMPSKPGLAATFYMPETIRSEIYQRNEEVFLQTDLRQYPDLPEHVEMFSELTPLESAVPHALATSYRAVNRQSAEQAALRRLHSFNASISKRLDTWKMIDHPNVVKLNDYFTTKAFGDNSLVLVYDYHPGSVTLMSKYLSGGSSTGLSEAAPASFHDPFSSDPDAPRPYTHQKNAMLRAVACGALLPEAVLWSMLIQLTAALRAIHGAGLACRSLDPTKVVINGCRVRMAWCGAADALHNNTNDVLQAQQEDLHALGRLALALACRSALCENLPASIDLVARTYSADLKNLILYLLSTTTARRSVTDLMPMIGARFYTQVEALQRRADVFEEQLAREMDNSRLLRILLKLGVVNERPELNMDPSWAETGDRYMLKLFRDYMFHSVTEDGRPWLDQAHITHCLNQLDGGTNVKVELMSRDEQSILVVSYAELKHCLEQAFEEVMQAAAST